MNCLMPNARVINSETLMDRVNYWSIKHPDKKAYIYLRDDGAEDTITFGQLKKQVRAVANRLSRIGEVGDRAILLYPPGLDFIISFLGCLRAGLIAVPANLPSKNRPDPRLQLVIKDAQPKFCLSTSKTIQAFNLNSSFGLDGSELIPTNEITNYSLKNVELPKIKAEDIAFIQYSSGSTGDPKGIMVSNSNLINNERSLYKAFGNTSNHTMVGWLPMFHDMGLIGVALQPLFAGYTCVLLSPTQFLRKPQNLLKAISRYEGTLCGGPNFTFEHCIKTIKEEDKAGIDLQSWKIAYNGSEPVRANTLESFAKYFADCGFSNKAFWPCYGLAESTLFVTSCSPEKSPLINSFCIKSLEKHKVLQAKENDGGTRKLVGCGSQWDDEQIAIINPDNFTQCQSNEIGEIWIKSKSVAQGYWRRPDLTRETFQGVIANNGEGTFLRTGDLGFFYEGELFITGRLKDLIIIRGRNIYPQDIEAIVEREIDFIKPNSCAAFSFGADDEERLVIVAEANRSIFRKIQSENKKESVNEPQPNKEISGVWEELNDYFKKATQAITEEFQVSPYNFIVVRPATFPRTTSGKVRRKNCQLGLLNNKLEIIYDWKKGNAPKDDHVSQSCKLTEKISLPASDLCETSDPVRKQFLSPQESKKKSIELINWIREYADTRINSQLMDERRCIPPYIVMDFADRGLMGLQTPINFGGLGLNTTDSLRVFEQLGAVDITLASFVGLHNGLGVRPILNYGSDELKKELLPNLATGRKLAAFALTEPIAGSNPNAIQTQAVKHGDTWRISGEKSWTGLGSWAGVITVMAKEFDERGNHVGPTAFAVKEGSKGLKYGPEALTMGVRGIVQNSLILDNAAVSGKYVLGKQGEGMKVAQDAMMYCRLIIGAVSIGAMKRCAQLLARYGERRSISTGSLLSNPVTLLRLHDINSSITATEALIYKIAELLDGGEDIPEEIYLACKTSGPEFLWKTVDTLMQALGGRGYIESNIVAQLFRDARLLRIFEGPTEPLNMHLGSLVIQNSSSLIKFMANYFNSENLGTELLATIEHIKNNCIDSTSLFPEEKTRTQWLMFITGEITTATLVLAATEYRSRKSPDKNSKDACLWARENLESIKENYRMVFERKFGPGPVQNVMEMVNSYENSIGNIEQNLPGEDHLMDEYLRRNDSPESKLDAFDQKVSMEFDAQYSVAPDDEAPTETHQKIQEIILEWHKEEKNMDLVQISHEATFASFGIDSLSASTILLDIEEKVGINLPVDVLCEANTISSLAQHINNELGK